MAGAGGGAVGNVGKVEMIWKNVTVKLSDLKPWDHNPRTMTKKQAQRLLKSWQDLGQFQTIAIGPLVENGDGSKYCQVYDGHQRLSALLAAHGPDFSIDARQADRELSEDEQHELTIQANLPAGQWNWDALAGWDAAQLQEWGFDDEALKTWDSDATNLATMLEIDARLFNPEPQQEPILESECFIEIHCSRDDLQSMQEDLNDWATRPTVTINIS